LISKIISEEGEMEKFTAALLQEARLALVAGKTVVGLALQCGYASATIIGFRAGRSGHAALGVAVLLILGSLAVGARSTAAAAPHDPVRVVALLNVQFLNDHADLEPTTSAERVRLASVEFLFKAQLEASGQYKFVSVPADAAAKMAAGPEIGACGGCEFDYGKQLGADYAAWIVVQKVSDLILNINVYMTDVAAGKLVFVHSVDIRGNTDESWTRGIIYLVKNYLLAGQ
jgi:Protein of unknown function (DUF2380)